MKKKFTFLVLVFVALTSACTGEVEIVSFLEPTEGVKASFDFDSRKVCKDVMAQVVDENLDLAINICDLELSEMVAEVGGWPGQGCNSLVHNCFRDDVHHLAFEIVKSIGDYNSNTENDITYADGTRTPISSNNYTGGQSVIEIVDGFNVQRIKLEQVGVITPVP